MAAQTWTCSRLTALYVRSLNSGGFERTTLGGATSPGMLQQTCRLAGRTQNPPPRAAPAQSKRRRWTLQRDGNHSAVGRRRRATLRSGAPPSRRRLITEKDGVALAPTCWKKELLGATAQTGRAAQARLVPEHLGRAQSKLLRTRLGPCFIHGAPGALQHMQARAPHHAAACSLVCTTRRRTQKHVPHHSLFLPDCATHARPLLPAALAFVSFGFVLVRVRVRN